MEGSIQGGSIAQTRVPGNGNNPWDGDSPAHRHLNVTQLGDGILGGALAQYDGPMRSGRAGGIVDKLKAMLRG